MLEEGEEKLQFFLMGSSISGTYNGSLLINGAATITDAVTINGSLFCMGNLTNSEGYAVTVMSDVLIQGDMNFTPTDPTIFQEVVMIFGNLTVFGNISMLSNASSSGMFSASALIIFGNLTTVAMITSTLTASGNTAGADGLVIWVLGDAVLYEINLDGTTTKAVTYKDGSGHSKTTKPGAICDKVVARKSWSK